MLLIKVIIPFTYYCVFKKKGIYKIKYTFKNKLSNTCYMFSDCSSLININLSNFNTQNVTNMNSMFDGCSSLTNINLSNFNISKYYRYEEYAQGLSIFNKYKFI